MTGEAARRVKPPTISDIQVVKTTEGYRCKAIVMVDGETRSRTFLLLVPPGTYGKIEGHFGRFGTKEVEGVFEKRIRQSIQTGVLRTVPPSAEVVDLWSLHAGEIDALHLQQDAKRK